MRPPPICFTPSASASASANGTASTPAVHRIVRASYAASWCGRVLVRRLDAGLADVGDVHAEVSLDADLVESTLRRRGQFPVERREHAIVAVEQQHPCLVRVDGPEFVGERVHRQFPDLARQFDSGGSAAGDGERQPRSAFLRGGQRFGHLEGGNQTVDGWPGRRRGFSSRAPIGCTRRCPWYDWRIPAATIR